MYCENCGAKNEDDALFCSECGTPLPQIQMPGQGVGNQSYGHPAGGTHFQPQPDSDPRFRPEAPKRPPQKASSKKPYPLIAAAAVLGVLIVIMAAVLVKTSMDTNNKEDEELEALLKEADEEGEDASSTDEDEAVPSAEPTEEVTQVPTAEVTPEVTAAPTQAPTPVPTQEVTPVPTQAPTVEYVAVKYGLQAPASDFMFPYSSERLLTQAELDSMVDGSVEVMHSRSQLAINEILARYGYSFNPDGSDTSREIYNRVAGKDWYQQAQQQCGYSDPNSLIADMNSVEKENIDMVNEWQKAHGCYY